MSKAFTMVPQEQMAEVLKIINSCRNTIDGITELHKKYVVDEFVFCSHCEDSNTGTGLTTWPCLTMQIVIDNA